MLKIVLCSIIAVIFYGSQANASIVNIKDEVAARVEQTQREKKIHPITYLLDKLRQSHNLRDIWDPDYQLRTEPTTTDPISTTTELPHTTVANELPVEVTETLHHTSYYYPTYAEVPPNHPVHHYSRVDQPSSYRTSATYKSAPNHSRKLSSSYSVKTGKPKMNKADDIEVIPRSRGARGRTAKLSRSKYSSKTTTTKSPQKHTTSKTNKYSRKTTTTCKPKTTTTPKPIVTTKKMVITFMKSNFTTTRRPNTRRPPITTTPEVTTTIRRRTTTMPPTTTQRRTTTTTATTTRRPTTFKHRTTSEQSTTRRTVKLKPLSNDQEIMLAKIRDVAELKDLVQKFRHSYHVKYTERHNTSKAANLPQPDASPNHKTPLFKITDDSAINYNYIWEMNQMMNNLQLRYPAYDPQINEVLRSAASILSIYGVTKPEKSEVIDINHWRNGESQPPATSVPDFHTPSVPVMIHQIYRYPLVMDKTSPYDF